LAQAFWLKAILFRILFDLVERCPHFAMTPFAAPSGLTLQCGSVYAPDMLQRTAMLQRKSIQQKYCEDDTTDAGSSDADSSCSSGSEGGSQSGRSFKDWAAASRLRRLAPQKLAMGKKTCFSSTPLAPIPGTPNAEHQAPTEKPNQKQCTTENAMDVLATAPPSVPGGHCISTGKSHHAGAASKQSMETVLARAKRQSLPLKLQLPAHLERACRLLDPSMPAKKKPAYVEFSAATVADMQTLDPNMPLKKTVSRFLLENSQPNAATLVPR